MSGGKLADRVAIVTGGARGIGRGIALAFAREGADVAVVDRDAPGAERVAGEVRTLGRRALALAVDVRSEDETRSMAERTRAELGRIDVLVSNAGVATSAFSWEMPLSMWQETIDVDLTGVFLCAKAVLPTMIEQGSGRIVNVGSQLGIRGAPTLAHYCAAKAGVHGLTRALAYEVAEKGITVNAIAPGPTRTEMLDPLPGEVLEGIRQEVLLKRFATVDEIAPTAVLLASDDGGFYTGATLNVSGGHAMY